MYYGKYERIFFYDPLRLRSTLHPLPTSTPSNQSCIPLFCFILFLMGKFHWVGRHPFYKLRNKTNKQITHSQPRFILRLRRFSYIKWLHPKVTSILYLSSSDFNGNLWQLCTFGKGRIDPEIQRYCLFVMDLEVLQPSFISGEKSVIQNILESSIYTVYNSHWM